MLANKRLKLTGADRFRGIVVFIAMLLLYTFSVRYAGGRVARSLSAIR